MISAIKGFTFIELLVVITILGLLTAIATPQFKNSFDHVRLNNTLSQLQNYIAYLHQKSIIEKEIILLKVNNPENRYWAEIGESDGRYLKSYSFPSEYRLNIIKITNPDEEAVIFYPDGSIDAVTLELISAKGDIKSITTQGVWGGSKIKDAQ